jgi:hypothetical protein
VAGRCAYVVRSCVACPANGEQASADDDSEQPEQEKEDDSEQPEQEELGMANVKEWIKQESSTGVEWEGGVFAALIGGDDDSGGAGSDASGMVIALQRVVRDLTAVKKQLEEQRVLGGRGVQ